MTRTLDALRLVVEELEEHEKRINSVEKEQIITNKVAIEQAKEIEQLKARVRDMEIREKVRLGSKQKDIAEEYNLSPGRISQITRIH